jgi:GAF domain-containing protein
VSEGIGLPPLARGTVLPEPQRLARLDAALPSIAAALSGEVDEIAMEATLACLLFETLAQASFCGFYRRVAAEELAVGPYQGPMGCLRIAFSRGVCGACARTRTVQLVPDVHAFPGHIACDDGARSELVLPVLDDVGALRAVLDLDSHAPAAFSQAEAGRIAGLLAQLFGAPGVRWSSVRG